VLLVGEAMSSHELFEALWECRLTIDGPHIVHAGTNSYIFDPPRYVTHQDLENNHKAPPPASRL